MILASEGTGGVLAPVDPGPAASGDDVVAEGLESRPKPNLTLKEFEKAPLTVRSGKVHYGERPLLSPQGPVMALGAEGSTVR
jgi:hypothetical protein